jgi:hypothetical protein
MSADYFWKNNAAPLKKELLVLVKYFQEAAKDPALAAVAEKAIAMLAEYPPKIDAHTFGSDDAHDMVGRLSGKGIGDLILAWPPAMRAEYEKHSTYIAQLTAPFYF